MTHKCDSCDGVFDFPDYIPYTQIIYQRQNPNAWSSGMIHTGNPPMTAACPHCRRPINHGNLDKYQGKDDEFYENPSDAEETFQGIKALDNLE